MPSAIILGGGIAGTAAGLALVQAGWQVRVFERAAMLEAVGGALSIWLVARGEAEASLLPLLGEYGADGRLASLFGHMARRNTLHARLHEAPAATILFNGPHG